MIEILVGVNVTNPELYAEYRARMTPLLHERGGSFVVDVQVAEVLRSPEGKPFNRLFTIRFPSEEQLEAFFALPEYRKIRQEFFDPSVSDTSRLGRYALLTGADHGGGTALRSSPAAHGGTR